MISIHKKMGCHCGAENDNIIPFPTYKEKSVYIRKLLGHCGDFGHTDLYLFLCLCTKFDPPIFMRTSNGLILLSFKFSTFG